MIVREGLLRLRHGLHVERSIALRRGASTFLWMPWVVLRSGLILSQPDRVHVLLERIHV